MALPAASYSLAPWWRSAFGSPASSRTVSSRMRRAPPRSTSTASSRRCCLNCAKTSRSMQASSARSTKCCRRVRSETGWRHSRSGGATGACSTRSMLRSLVRNSRRRMPCSRRGTAMSLPSSTSLAMPKAPGSGPRTCPCWRYIVRSVNPGRARSWRSPSSTRMPARSTRTSGQPACRAGWSWRRSPPRRWRCCRASCSAAAARSSARARH